MCVEEDVAVDWFVGGLPASVGARVPTTDLELVDGSVWRLAFAFCPPVGVAGFFVLLS